MRLTTHKLISTTAAVCLLFCTTTSVFSQTEFAGSLNTVSISDAAGTNKPPTASFTYTKEGAFVTFDATASIDPDGSIREYRWDFGDGATATGPKATHEFVASEDYPVTLTVVDNAGGIGLTQIRTSIGSCSSTPSVTQATELTYIAKIGNFDNVYFRGTTYHGAVTKNLCRVDIAMKTFQGNITDKNFFVEIYTLGEGNKLEKLIATSNPVNGSLVPSNCGMVSFAFNMPAKLAPGDAIVVKMGGEMDSNNYAGSCNNAFKNQFTDGEMGTWQKDFTVQDISTNGTDLGFKLYEVQ